jgi:hypothetical protein
MRKILAVKNALKKAHCRSAFVQNVPCGNVIIEVDTYQDDYKNGGISYVNGSCQKVLFKNTDSFIDFIGKDSSKIRNNDFTYVNSIMLEFCI